MCSRGQEGEKSARTFTATISMCQDGSLEACGGGEFLPLLHINAPFHHLFNAFLRFTVGLCITADVSLALLTHNAPACGLLRGSIALLKVRATQH